MNDQKFKKFINLVAFDQNLTELEKTIATMNLSIEKLHDQLNILEKKFTESSAKKHDLAKQLNMQELQVKEIQAQEQHEAEIITSIASSKEYDAAQKELEHIKFNRNQQEQKMLQLINKVGLADKDYEALKVTYEAEKEKINTQIEVEKIELQKIQEQINALYQERTGKLQDIEPDWLNVYENMRGRVADPVVKVNQDSCSVCFYLISSKDLQSLKQHELLQCKDCYRFLYYEDAT